MLNLNTADFPFAALAAPPSTASAPFVVDVENPGPALTAVPANAFNSVFEEPEAGTNQSLEPSAPFKNIVPVPKFATYDFGVDGAAATAVPPVVVV